MRKATYIGKTVNLGRHGIIKTGDTVYLWDTEWEGLKNDPDFKLLEGQEIVEHTGPVTNPPCATPTFDLRGLRWNSGRLMDYLSRFNKTKLLKIAGAMTELGLPVLATRDCPIGNLVDSIHHHAVANGWHRMSRAEILSSGSSPTRRRKK